MASLTSYDRCFGAIVGSIVADASAVNLHWIYKQEDLKSALSTEGVDASKPEFLSCNYCPFWKIPNSNGHNSCYGDQTVAILRSLSQTSGFEKEQYKKTLVNMFGADTIYDTVKHVGHPHTKADLPLPCAWQNASMKHAIKQIELNDQHTGADDKQADCLARLAPVVAFYLNDNDSVMVEKVEEITRVTQDNDFSVQCAVAGARILRTVMKTGTLPNLTELSWSHDLQGPISEALAIVNEPHIDAVQKLGSSCALPNNLQCTMHLLASQQTISYVDAVRLTILAGGDNCSRSCYVGAVYGALWGMEAIPDEWMQKTKHSDTVISMAQSLLKGRVSA